MKTAYELNLIAALALVTEKLEDARYLIQEINEEFFDKFDPDDDKDRLNITWEYPRYAAFFRILMLSVDDIYEVLKNAELKKKTAELALETVNQQEDI